MLDLLYRQNFNFPLKWIDDYYECVTAEFFYMNNLEYTILISNNLEETFLDVSFNPSQRFLCIILYYIKIIYTCIDIYI